MNDREKAFSLAMGAAELDFSAALQGLMAGHSAKIESLTAHLTRKDAALLASLALSKKGARIGADDGLSKTIIAGLELGPGASKIERDFISENKA